MNSQKKSFRYVLHLLVCLILLIASYLNLQRQKIQPQNEYSLAEIRDNYTRIIVERGSELIKKSKEALQMAIFAYLVAQKKLSDVRMLGLNADSMEYKHVEDEFKYALDSLRMARNNWENRVKMNPIFSYKKEHVTKNGARQSIRNYDLNSLFLTTRKGYAGNRGIDFQTDIYEETDPIYTPHQAHKKLNKNTINNLNLGFKFEDLPTKLVKSINDRENNRKQARLGKKNRQAKNSPKEISSIGNLHFNSKYNKELLNIDKILNNKWSSNYLNRTGAFPEDIVPNGLKLNIPTNQKSNNPLNNKPKNYPNLYKKDVQANAKPKKSSGDERRKPERSRGVLAREPEIPIDVANQIEKKLGGPTNYIDLSVNDLSKDKGLSRLYIEYIQATLRCAQLYESRSMFDEIFLCSRRQIDLGFKLLQKLDELNINYTLQKSDILHIMNKFNIKSIRQPKTLDKTRESEEFLKLLIDNNIFNSNNSSDSNILNYNTLTDTHLINFDDKPDSEAISELNDTSKYFPDYLGIYMNRYGFTECEYLENPRLIEAINHLAALEAEFINSTEHNRRIEHHKICNYKILTDSIRAEILNKRAQKPLFNETGKI